MGFAFSITLFFAITCICVNSSNASEDVELKDPNLVIIATFAANSLLKNADDLGIQNTSSLHRIMDAAIMSAPTPPQQGPTEYMLTLELGNNCTSEDTCTGGRHICEVAVLDEPGNKIRTLEEDKSRCAEREPNTPLEFVDPSSTIATSLNLQDAATKALALKAVNQMGERRGGKHTLKHLGQARKVMMEETNSNLYYLTLYISTTEQDAINEVCEVTMEEALTNSEQTLQSLRCFTTGDNTGADKFGIARVPSDDLTPSLIRHAVLASLAIADAESLSRFQFKVIGYSLADARVSIDSGTRDLQLKLGLVPTLCIKRSENEEEEEESKACTIDIERDPSMCSITLTQWPWVSDGYLFSDFDCEPTNYEVIGEELEAYTDEDSAAAGEEGAEVEEVSSNAVQAANRRESIETDEEEEAVEGEEKEVEEEVFVARSAPCVGCASDIDVNSDEVKALANLALSALENIANAEKVQSVARIVKASSQVVSGSLYILTIELVDTNCPRDGNTDRSGCTADFEDGQRRMCTVGIWDQPWLNSKQIREPSCETPTSSVKTRSLKDVKVGATTATTRRADVVRLSPDDEEVKDMAAFALGRLDAFDDNSKKRILDQVINVTSHSVGRSKTFYMKIRVFLADCPETSDAADPICRASLQQSSHDFFCDVQVLAQAGVGARYAPKRLVDSKCIPAKSVSSLPASEGEKDLVGEGSEQEQVSVQQQHRNVGATEPADTASPYIQSVADFATSAINQRTNGNSLKLVRVVRAETQLVAGKKIILDVEVGITNCTKADGAGTNCHIDNSQANSICRVTVWDRAWLNDRRVTNMTCDSISLSQEDVAVATNVATEPPSVGLDSVSSSSPIVGGHVQTDTMSSEIEAYTDFALAVIEEQSNAEEKLKVAKILASSIQIVQGKNIRLSLEVASTRCKKDQPIGDICAIDESKEFQICNIQIWDRAWLQEKQVTDLNCQPKRVKSNERIGRSEDMDESPFVGDVPPTFRLGSGTEFIPKASRSRGVMAQKNLPLLGGFSPVDLKDPTILEIANFASTSISQSLNRDPSNSESYTLTKIHKAEKQVVAGINYRLELELTGKNQSIKYCRVTVLDQPWISERKVTNTECSPQSFTSNARQDKNALGGYRPAAVNDAAVREAAAFAVLAMSKASPNATYSLMKVKNSARQIASKQVNYKLTMQLRKGNTTVICDAIVAEKSARQLVSSSCRNKTKRRRSVVGGYSPVDINDQVVKEIADFSTVAISQATNGEELSVMKVISAETQVVSGKNYKITLKAKSSSGVQICNVIVYDQSWTKTRKLTSFKCQNPSGSRKSRQQPIRPRRPVAALAGVRPNNAELSIQPPSHCVGGYCPIDPNEKAVKEMARFATMSLSRSMNSGPLQLAKVRFAERQVVAGFNYRLELEFNGAKGAVLCRVVVFDQAWTKTRQVTQSQCEEATPIVEVPPPVLPQRIVPAPVPGVVASIPVAPAPALPVLPVPVAPARAPAVPVPVAPATPLVFSSFQPDPVKETEVIAEEPGLTDDFVEVEPDNDEALTSIKARQLGAYFSVSPNDEEVVEIALYATSLLSISRNVGDLKLETIVSASKQVVDGSNYQLNLKLNDAGGNVLFCDVVIHNIPKARQMLLSSCSPLSRSKRSSDQITGGITPMDTRSNKVKELTDFAVSTISLRSNEPNAPNAVQVLKATKQVVSGMKYTLELEMSFVDCPQNTEACTRRQKCSISIWEQPWLQKREITKLSCKDIKVKTSSAMKTSSRRQLLGGVTPADPSSEEIQAHAEFALQAVQAQSNARKMLSIVRIKNAATQTVSGKKIYLTIEVGETECAANDRIKKPCPFDGEGERQLCKIEIWTRPWLKERQVTSLKCASLGSNRKCNGKSCKRYKRSTETDLPKHSHHHKHNHHSKIMKKSRKLKHMTAFRNYMKQFDKVFKTWEEFEHRYKIYRANQERIELLNRYEMGTAVYGDTPFSDWSAAEYKAHLAGLRPLLRQSNNRLTQAVIPKIDLPDAFDWRNQSAVTPVKDQGACGSCWAFSVTGNIEGIYAARNGELLSLSEQELVDCDKLDSGCNGGLPENAYKAIHELGGLEAESDYPYNGHQNSCKFNSNITRVQVTGGVEISKNETEMAQWLVQNGPISIGINANVMQFYRGGVSHPWKALCRAGGIDHGVLIVGYGVSNYPKFNKTLPYWIVKNSWGTKWGEQGYYRVFRGDGTCGLNQMCTSATLD